MMTIAVIAVSSVWADPDLNYDQFLQQVKDDIDVDAIALKVLQNMQSENSENKSPQNVEEFVDQIQFMVKNNASKQDWTSMKDQWMQYSQKYYPYQTQYLAKQAKPVKATKKPAVQHLASNQRNGWEGYMDYGKQWFDYPMPSFAAAESDSPNSYPSATKSHTSHGPTSSQRSPIASRTPSSPSTPDQSQMQQGQATQQSQQPDWMKMQNDQANYWTNYGMNWAQKFGPGGFLVSLADSFSSEEQSQQFWGDKELSITPQQITVRFDSMNNLITVLDDQVDAKGRPIHEVQMNKKTGHMVQTKRSKDGSQTFTKQKNIGEVQGKEDAAISQEKTDALIKQRTIAYIVMIVFIILFVATLCLVAVFLKIKKNQDLTAANLRNFNTQNKV